MDSSYEYQPPTGPLSGDSFENQTEDFFSRLRLDINNNANAIDAVQRSQAQLESAVENQIAIFEGDLADVADRIDGAISTAADALTVAQAAKNTADSAASQVDTAIMSAANAQESAASAQSSATQAGQRAAAAETAAQAAQQAAASAVQVTGAQTVGGVKTFTDSPIVPTPTTDTQAATKKYVDDAVSTAGKTYSGTAPISVNNTTDTISVSAASTSAAGVVQLNNSTSSTSQTQAATPKAVSDALAAAQTYADSHGKTYTGSSPISVSGTTISVGSASTSSSGVVQLNNATNSTSQTQAATPKAVNDALSAAKTYADSAGAHAAMPNSSRVSSLSIPSNEGTVTAPADGWLAFYCVGPSAQATIWLRNNTTNIGNYCTNNGGAKLCVSIPVSKNDVVVVHYSVSSGAFSSKTLNFIYANGA